MLKACVPSVVLATCKVGQEIYTCIYPDGVPFAMKCVYVEFSPSKQQSFFSKISLNSCFIELNQLYTRHAGGSSRGKDFNKNF